jgi:hypothetical protein
VERLWALFTALRLRGRTSSQLRGVLLRRGVPMPLLLTRGGVLEGRMIPLEERQWIAEVAIEVTTKFGGSPEAAKTATYCQARQRIYFISSSFHK